MEIVVGTKKWSSWSMRPWLVLTHFDLDHVGAATSLAGRVGTVLHGPVAEPAETAASLASTTVSARPPTRATTGSVP